MVTYFFPESVEKIALLKESRLQAEDPLGSLLSQGAAVKRCAARSCRDRAAKVNQMLIDQMADYIS